MEDTKLVRILSNLLAPKLPLSDGETLNRMEKEIRRLRNFLHSPFFSTTANVISFFEFIVQFAPEFHDVDLNDEKAAAAIFPNGGGNTGQIRRIRSKLLRQIETYIHIRETLSDPWAEKLAVLRFLGRNRLIDEFYGYLEHDVWPALGDGDYPKSSLFERKYRVDEEIVNVKTTFQEDNRSGLHFQETTDAFDLFYFHQKLIQACQMLNRQNVFPECEPYDLRRAFEVVAVFQKESAFSQSPVIEIWLTAFRMLSATEADLKMHWEKLRELIDAHFTQLSPNEIHLIYIYLQNNARGLATDEREWYRIFIELYESQMDKEVFQNYFTLTGAIFYNVIQTYLALNDIEGAEKSMANYKGILPVLGAEFAGLCAAAIAFAKSDFETALDHLNGIEGISNVYINLKYRRLCIKTYVELGDDYWRKAEAEISNFRTYMTRHANSIGEFHTEANREFNNFTEKLIKIGKTNKRKLAILEEAIRKFPRLPERAWLLAKCGQWLN